MDKKRVGLTPNLDAASESLLLADCQRIDSICDEFEGMWGGESHVSIGSLLALHSDVPKAPLLKNLLRIELHLRRAAGEVFSYSDYRKRFPSDRRIVNQVWNSTFGIDVETTHDAEFNARLTNPTEKGTSPLPPLPEKIGRFLIQRLLGRGSFGDVYLAEDPLKGCNVALKVLLSNAFSSPRSHASFLREAHLGQGVDHPHLVQTLGFENIEDQFVIVQQYIDGQNLMDWQARVRPTHNQIIKLLIPVAEALGYLHQKHIFHRDLKPSNILVDAQDQAFIVDFGLALPEKDQRDRARRGEVAGTFAYMSPEQFRGEPHLIDGQSDIWSFGVVLYRLLTGRYPFGGTPTSMESNDVDYFHEIKYEVDEYDPRPLRQIDASISRKLEKICFRCLERRKRDRYATGYDLADDLSLALKGRCEDSPGRRNSEKPQIVLKGLRSFEAGDAYCFLDLLPGPRMKNGLPASLNFWKKQLGGRGEGDPIELGVIYGPSGCGKSSFVKAGLIPRLGDQTLVIMVDSTPDSTEITLLKKLKKMIPQLPQEATLVEVFEWTELHGAGDGRKLLIVFDQFEQWLHSHSLEANQPLQVALGRCNGVRLQTLLIVRDDFWMPLTRFMDRIEIPLQEGTNIAAIDLFDREHARKVLTSLGRAYGRLDVTESGSESRMQKEFLDIAIEGLAVDGHVICVHLILFAEMMKARPWTPNALANVGGPKATGFDFLERSLGLQAPVAYKPYRAMARRILAELLPPLGSELKGQMKSLAELRETIGTRDDASVRHVLHILDSDLRLITPVVQNFETDSLVDSGQIPYPVFYQLTHDYLVPSIQDWLAYKQKQTRIGRVELLLADQATVWNHRHEARQLPSLWEWIEFLRLTTRKKRTPPQQSLMIAARNYYLTRCGLMLTIMLLVGYFFAVSKSESLVDGIMNCDLSRVAERIRQIGPYRYWVDPLLYEEIKNGNSQEDPTKFMRAQIVRAQIALLPSNEKQLQPILNYFLTADVYELVGLRAALSSSSRKISEGLWPILSDPEGDQNGRLRAAVLLAEFAPKDPRWIAVRKDVITMLLDQEEYGRDSWVAPLSVLWESLLPELEKKLIATDESKPDAKTKKSLIKIYDQVARVSDEGYQPFQGVLQEESPPQASDADQNKTALRKAYAAVAMIVMKKNPEKPWDSLSENKDPAHRRSNFIQRRAIIEDLFPVGGDVRMLLQHLDHEPDTTVKETVLRAFDHLEFSRVKLGDLSLIKLYAVRVFESDPSASIHGHAEWLIREVNRTAQLEIYDFTRKKVPLVDVSYEWDFNVFNQTMVLVQCSLSDEDRQFFGENPAPQNQYLLAVMNKEVTEDLYSKVMESPGGSEFPKRNLNSHQMALFCNELSKKEGIPLDQWCFESVPNTGPRGQMRLVSDFGRRTGFRFATRDEYRQITRLRPDSFEVDQMSRNDESQRVGVFNLTNQLTCAAVARLMPNHLGIFDLQGSVQELSATRIVGANGEPEYYIVGGSYKNHQMEGVNQTIPHDYCLAEVGFRVVRTMSLK